MLRLCVGEARRALVRCGSTSIARAAVPVWRIHVGMPCRMLHVGRPAMLAPSIFWHREQRSLGPSARTETTHRAASAPAAPDSGQNASNTPMNEPPAPPLPLSEDIMTVPNVLTMLRVALCPVIGWAVATQQPSLTLGLLTVAGLTDLLDGWIARRYQSKTVFGSVADPAADKLLMATMVVGLTLSGTMPLPLAAIIFGRDVFLVVLAFYMRYGSLPPPRTLRRYFDPRLPSVHVTPTRLSKFNTFLQLVLVGSLTLLMCLPEEWRSHPHTQRTIKALEWVVAGTTLWTGIDYAISRRSVRYLLVKR